MAAQAQRTIVLCFPNEERHRAAIQAAAPDDRIIDAGQEGVAEALFEADIFCGHAKVPVAWPEIVEQGKLKWIQSSAAGMDHCLVPPVIDSSIVVSSASGLFAHQVAEQTLAILLGLLRSMPVFTRAQQQREFVRRPTDDLRGKTVGIVGFGGNGRKIAEVLAGWDVRLLATDVYPVHKPNYVDELWPADEVERLLGESDVVILCVPLNDSTNRWFDASRLSSMRQGSYLINVARGPVVVESALVDALQSGHLKAAGLDVTETEPLPTSSPLWDLENVWITPHVGAQSSRRVDDSTALFCRNIGRFNRGQRLLNQVDKTLGFPRPEDHQGLQPDEKAEPDSTTEVKTR